MVYSIQKQEVPQPLKCVDEKQFDRGTLEYIRDYFGLAWVGAINNGEIFKFYQDSRRKDLAAQFNPFKYSSDKIREYLEHKGFLEARKESINHGFGKINYGQSPLAEGSIRIQQRA